MATTDAYLAMLFNSLKSDIILEENPTIVRLISKHVQMTLPEYMKLYNEEHGLVEEKKKASGGRNSYHEYLAKKKEELGEAYDYNDASKEYQKLSKEERKQYAPEKTAEVTAKKKTKASPDNKWREFCKEWSENYKRENEVEKLPQNWMELASVEYKKQKESV
jgi:hypothetical protein